MSPVISVENLSKKYIIGHKNQERYVALRDVIAQGAKNIWQRAKHPLGGHDFNDPHYEEFFALKDVSFEIKQGDRVGIIGRNGAGKSTLLKVLSRITEPTSGKIKIRGRVASLLEVGTGFHPELTGRENIFLNGAILGMSKAEITKKFDEIVAFAEVEKFLDTPVKRYSSGMYVRLAFAVAAHLEPEILIVDEVLAVGDVNFRKKCMGKMKSISEKENRTIIFVSHDMAAIQSLCNKGMVFAEGQSVFSGNPHEAVKFFLESGSKNKNLDMKWSMSPQENEPFKETIKILGYSVQDVDGKIAHSQLLGSKKYRVAIQAEILKVEPNIDFFVSVYLEDGTLLYITDLYDYGNLTPGQLHPGKIDLSFELPTHYLSSQRYYLEMSCLIHYRGWPLPFNRNEQTRLYFDFFRDDHSNLLYGNNHPMTSTQIRPGLLSPVVEWRLKTL